MSTFWNAVYETGSSFENKLMLKRVDLNKVKILTLKIKKPNVHTCVGGREANVNSVLKVHPSAYHDVNQSRSSMQ